MLDGADECTAVGKIGSEPFAKFGGFSTACVIQLQIFFNCVWYLFFQMLC